MGKLEGEQRKHPIDQVLITKTGGRKIKRILQNKYTKCTISANKTGFIETKVRSVSDVISIREVAELAGVSPATVSRVINGTAKVAPEKRDRILKVIGETNFLPNELARSLYKKSTKLIGLVIPGLQTPYFTQLAGELSRQRRSAATTCSCATWVPIRMIKSALQMLISKAVDGIVLAVSGPEVDAYLPQCTIPIVAVDCMERSEYVRASLYCDYYAGGRMAAEHLLDSGCKRMVCIKSDQNLFRATGTPAPGGAWRSGRWTATTTSNPA